MNKLIAVSPQFAQSPGDILELMAEFGPYVGRYIASFPKNWERLFKSHLEDVGVSDNSGVAEKLSPLARKRLEELLNPHAANSVTSRFAPYLDTCEMSGWNEFVRRELLKSKTYSISNWIGDTYGPSDSTWQYKKFEFQDASGRPLSMVHKGSVREFIDLIQPLLRKGPEAYFIDPYFRPDTEFHYKLIRAALQSIAPFKCFHLHFVIDYKSSLKDFHRLGKDENLRLEHLVKYKDFLNAGFKSLCEEFPQKGLHFHLVDDSRGDGWIDLHDRFFLTKFGMIKFGRGFHDRSGSRKSRMEQNASVQGPGTHLPYVEKYIDLRSNLPGLRTITVSSIALPK